MEKGHFGGYTGNARHSRKEEMIHDRELIYDAKKQLHNADKDYKSDSPAHRALVGNQDRLPGIVKKAISDAPAQMNADLAYDPVNDIADSPMSMYGKKQGSPVENSGLGPKTADSGIYNTDELRGKRQRSSIHNFLSEKKQERIKSNNVSAETSSNIDEKLKRSRPGNGSNTSTSDSKTTATVPNNVSQGASSGQSSRNLSRKRGKQARTEAKLARAEAGSKKAGRIKGKLAKTDSQIGHLESKIKNAKTPKSSGGSGGKGGSSGSGGSGSRITNNIYLNSAAKMNGSPLNNVACKYTKRK